MITSRVLLTPLLLVLGTVNAQPYRWSEVNALSGPARHAASAFTIGQTGYICAGETSDGTLLNDLWSYTPTSDTWTQLGDFPGAPRRGAAGFAIGNKGYLASGTDGSTVLNDFWEYDPATDDWMQKAPLPFMDDHGAGFAIDGFGYLITSSSGTQYLWQYDPVSDVWSPRANFPGSGSTGCFVIGGKAYVGGNDLWEYDPIIDTWIVRSGFYEEWYPTYVAFAIAGKGFLIAAGPAISLDQNHPIICRMYDPVADTWQQVRSFAGISRDGASAFAIDNKGYVGMGSHFAPWHGETFENYRESLADLWAYDPFDCLGVFGGTAWPGTPCDDGDPGTSSDVFGLDCTCMGGSLPNTMFHPDLVDPTYSTGSGFNGEVTAIAMQPDGKVVAVGTFTTFNGAPCNYIGRLNANGTLDATFTGAISGTTVVVQPDGKVIVGGWGLHRLNADGSLDPSFIADPFFSGGSQVALQADGKILAAGFYSDGNTDIVPVVRLNTDGSVDPSFTGYYSVGPVYNLTLTPDQRVLVGSDDENPSWNECLHSLSTDGSLDEIFDPGWGFSMGAVHTIALRADGGVMAGGDHTLFNDNHHEQDGRPIGDVARLTADGALDPSFDVQMDLFGVVRALALGPDDRTLVGGEFTTVSGEVRNRIALLNEYGYPDLSFDPGNGFDATPHAFILQPDGQLIVAGAFTSYNGIPCGGITRLKNPGPTCIPSQLTTTADPVITCGAVNLKLNGTSTIAATEVPGANKYQFRFTNTAGQPAYARTIAFPTRSFTLTPWYTKPLKAGRTYNVQVHASFDNGATWCDYGPSCTVKISWTPLVPFAEPRGYEAAYTEEPTELLLYPNPTNGDQVRIRLSGIDPELSSATLDITDLFGKRVMSTTLPLQDGALNTSLALPGALADGLYIVSIVTGEQRFIERLMIAR